MNSSTQAFWADGPAGRIECALDRPEADTPRRGLALLAHPHPLFGGSMDNKVVMTLARAAVAEGWLAVRFNFRGVGASEGQWDQGRGEVDDARAVLKAALATPGAEGALLLGGFSFGGYVAAALARRLTQEPSAPALERLVLVAPAVSNFDVGTLPTASHVLWGEADDVVPLSAAFDWARPQALPLTVLPGAGHFFHGQLPLLKRLLQTAMR
jgi:uncharacterized protein